MKPALYALAMMLGGLFPAAAAAQSMALGGDGDPIEVTADGTIEWAQEEARITALGNARAVRGGVAVTAERLSAFYRETDDGDTDVYRLEAEGEVTIATDLETATGRRAVYELDRRRFTLEGAPATLATPTETITAENGIVYDEAERVAVAEGNATVRREGRVLRAQRLTARLEPDAEGALRVGAVDAGGGVTLTNDGEVVSADSGRYDAASSIVTLSGSVKITRDQSQLNGGYAEVNLDTGVSRLYAAPPGAAGGRVQGRLVPQDMETEDSNR